MGDMPLIWMSTIPTIPGTPEVNLNHQIVIIIELNEGCINIYLNFNIFENDNVI